jgi:hypothetical protein
LIGLSGLHLRQRDGVARGVPGVTTERRPEETVDEGGIVVQALVLGERGPVLLPLGRVTVVSAEGR